jgi:hypothetical protein
MEQTTRITRITRITEVSIEENCWHEPGLGVKNKEVRGRGSVGVGTRGLERDMSIYIHIATNVFALKEYICITSRAEWKRPRTKVLPYTSLLLFTLLSPPLKSRLISVISLPL